MIDTSSAKARLPAGGLFICAIWGMIVSDSDYFAARAAAERRMADQATGLAAKTSHRQLAELYEAASGSALADKAIFVIPADHLTN